jgi:hypothetical protein
VRAAALFQILFVLLFVLVIVVFYFIFFVLFLILFGVNLLTSQLMGSLLDFALPCRPSATLPEERGPTEARPGRKAGTDGSCAID